jgi:hypothetical protein
LGGAVEAVLVGVVGLVVVVMILSAIGDMIEGVFDFLGPVFGFLLLIGLLVAVCS